MNKLGKIHLSLPSTTKILRDFEDTQLFRALPRPLAVCEESVLPSEGVPPDQTVIPVTEPDEPPRPLDSSISIARPASVLTASPKPILRESSKTLGRIDEDAAPGHSTAAVLQRLRRPPESSLDLEMNLRLLDHDEEEDDATEVEELISRQPSKGLEPPLGGRVCIRSRSPSEAETPQELVHPPRSPKSGFPIRPSPLTPVVLLETPPLIPTGGPGASVRSAKTQDVHRGKGTDSGHEVTPLKRIPGYR
eukprot:Gregarina_sp_Poly_1__5129@NODE_2714_length_1792_cov_326_837681_g58_i2_p1_GENE_NODE_2714_length_1792_cov_326_837681_g58_i2NODE_2714_length_1792_cov_326_837681_g58_i2_p1_ORF_typecomplete_len249_score43_15_NODE_2714_length_1792_cov_326_837681_g58_i29311677